MKSQENWLHRSIIHNKSLNNDPNARISCKVQKRKFSALVSPVFGVLGGSVQDCLRSVFDLARNIPHDMSTNNRVKNKSRLLNLKTQSVPRCKHFSSRL